MPATLVQVSSDCLITAISTRLHKFNTGTEISQIILWFVYIYIFGQDGHFLGHKVCVVRKATRLQVLQLDAQNDQKCRT